MHTGHAPRTPARPLAWPLRRRHECPLSCRPTRSSEQRHSIMGRTASSAPQARVSGRLNHHQLHVGRHGSCACTLVGQVRVPQRDPLKWRRDAPRTAAKSVISTLLTLMPCLGNTDASRREVPPTHENAFNMRCNVDTTRLKLMHAHRKCHHQRARVARSAACV